MRKLSEVFDVADDLRRIIDDPNLSNEEIAKRVRENLGNDENELFVKLDNDPQMTDADLHLLLSYDLDKLDEVFGFLLDKYDMSEEDLIEYAKYKRKQYGVDVEIEKSESKGPEKIVKDDKKTLFDRIDKEINNAEKEEYAKGDREFVLKGDLNDPRFKFLARSVNVSLDEIIEYAKYKRSQVIKNDKEKAKDSVSDNNVSQEKENNVSKSNDVKNDIVLSDDENELSKRLDEINKMFMSGEIVSQELNNERNSIINKMKEIKNSKMESTDKYPKLDSVDMSKLFKIYSKAEADNVYLNLMAEKYGVSKSAFHDMFKANMLKDSKIVENPSKKPEKIPSLDQNYNVKNRSINDVSGVYPLTVEKLSENGGLEKEERKSVVKIGPWKRFKNWLSGFSSTKESSEVVDNYLDNTQLNEGFKTESVEKEKSREEWQKRADEIKKAEKEAAENVAVNDEPEITKFNAR